LKPNAVNLVLDQEAATVPNLPLPYPPPAVAWFIVAVFFVIYSVSTLDRFVITLLVDPIRRDLGITDFQIGLLQSAFTMLYALAALPIGWLVDRWLRRRIIFIGMVCWSLATAACGLAGNFWQLFAARIGVGAGECTLAPTSYSVLADTFPKERLALATSTSILGSAFGQGMGMVLGGLLVAALTAAGPQTVPFLGKLQPWQLVFISVGLPGVFLSFLIFSFKEPARRRDAQSASKVLANPIGSISEYSRFFKARWRFILCHHLGIAFAFVVQAAMANWLPVYMHRKLGLGAAQVGTIYGLLYGLCTPIGLIIGGSLIDVLFRRGYRDAHMRVFLVCVLLVIPFGIFALTYDSLIVFIIGSALTQLSLGVLPAAGASSLQIVTPGNLRGRASAVFLLVYVVMGATLGPMLVGWVTDHIFHDDKAVGASICVVIAAFAPPSALALWLGLKPMRQAVAAADSGLSN
jgi:MFS family permease